MPDLASVSLGVQQSPRDRALPVRDTKEPDNEDKERLFERSCSEPEYNARDHLSDQHEEAHEQTMSKQPPILRLPSLKTHLGMSKASNPHSNRHHSMPSLHPGSIYKNVDQFRRPVSPEAPKPSSLLVGEPSYSLPISSLTHWFLQHRRLNSAPRAVAGPQSFPPDRPRSNGSSPNPRYPAASKRADTDLLTDPSQRMNVDRRSIPSFRASGPTGVRQRPNPAGYANASVSSEPQNVQVNRERSQRIQEEVQQSFEAIASELGRIDELSLSLKSTSSSPRRPGALRTNVTKEELAHRRQVALNLLNELHSRCTALSYTGKPSTLAVSSHFSDGGTNVIEQSGVLPRKVSGRCMSTSRKTSAHCSERLPH